MRRRYLKLALLAAQAAIREDVRHFRIGAAAIRGDGTLVSSSNGPAMAPCPDAHAEARLARKLDRNAEVLVVRLKRDGSYGMALPCVDCRKALALAGVAKVYYTTGHKDVIERLW